MWPQMFEYLPVFASAGLCALAVKLTDDYLDQEQDADCGRKNWASGLGVGAMVYASILLAIAALISFKTALPLYLASYAVGMFQDLSKFMPSRLRGWQESILVILVGICFLGWRSMVFALLFVIAVQLIDDCLDKQFDQLCGRRNLACLFGLTECWMLGIIALLSSWWLADEVFPPIFAAVACVYFIAFRLQGVKG